jgi:cell wall-associated NlpC family hydrolase
VHRPPEEGRIVDSGTRNFSARTGRRGVRTTSRLAGTAISVALLVGFTPAVADASPSRPSNSQIAGARAAANAVAARIGALSDTVDAAEAAVAAKQADADIALDEYQATHEAFLVATKKSDAAAAASAKAAADVGVARDEVIAFARRSYMDGSTYSGAAALITAANPGELIQRAALLEAAGTHRSDVLDTVTVLQGRAKAAETVARETLASADALQTRAADAMATAQAAEASARQQAAALVGQKAQLQRQLTAAKAQLVHLIGARAAADRTAQIVRPAAGPPPASVPPPPSGNENHAGNGNASAAQTAIDAAMAYRGTPYAWGGGGSAGPGPGLPPDRGVIGFDCSGLTQYAYARAGIWIPRNSRAQYADLPKVSSDDLRPGDLVFWATDPSDPGTIHHVAIYLGNGRVVQAPESGDVVKDSPMWWSGYAGAVRPTG